MNRPPPRPGAVLAAGLILGILGDMLLRAGGAPALNLFLWAVALAATVVVLQRRRGGPITVEAAVFFGIGLLFSATLAWRDSPALKLLALAAAAGAFALPALEAGAAWVRRSGVTGYALAAAAAAVHSGLGALPAFYRVDWHSLRDRSTHGSRWRRVVAVARGVVIALPLLLLFGALFVAADAVFERMVADATRVDLERLASHVLLVGFFGWIATGYL